MIDLAIIGGGPAALSAAIYAARAGLKVKVFEKKDFGGVLPEISQLENYPGFRGPGKDLAASMRQQAERVGAELEYGECTSVQPTKNSFNLTIDESPVIAKTVLIASGSEPKKLNFNLDTPVSYCALCDGALTKGKNIVVVGGANSAVQEALYLSNLAASVTIITHSKLKADQELLDRLLGVANIKTIEDLESTKDFLEQFDYCFVYIGKTPATHFLPPEILTKTGYVKCQNTGEYPHQTAISGLFTAGDVRQNSIKQVVTAAGDGAAAAIEITNYLKSK